ncbi:MULTISPECIES: hypothetical protein [Curtobacterium]|uniref:hypothetical protein n=1 Tax=Curtobacterium TaxID=2034 RepID=UPI000DA82E39|nr:hypothetical protein [Curtobacterium sp. MCLR17_054]WIE67096.1 hypothetical protein DEJ08_011210 [Curtobacterium sp. MCLR17_054]
MPNELEQLARKIQSLEDRIGSRNATQLDSSTIDVGDDDSLVVSDVMAAANEVATVAIPGLQEALDLNTARLQENSEAVAAALDAVDVAMELANAAEAAGIAAGEEASAAADDALEKAQEALDAAAAAGGGATYSGTAPAPGTPGTPGQQWFVWDSNYKITAYYVYDGPTSTWVQTAITDSVLGNISAGSITSGYLGAERIAAASLTAAVLAADTLTSREIGADAILARNIKAAEITGTKIAAATIAAGNIAAKTITAGQIAAGTITAGEIKAGTITANEIAAGTITATQINLDTLNGKTITGAVIKSAASGQRLEMRGTRLDVYGAGASVAASVVGIPGADNNTSAIQLTARDSTSAVAAVNVHGAVTFTPLSGPSCTYNMTLDYGLNATHVFATRVFTRTSSILPVLVIDGTSSGVVVTADDFRTADGSSISSDTGWKNLTLQNGWANQSGTRLRYRIKAGVFYLQGYLNSANATATTFATIPSQYTPSQNIRVPATNGTGSSGVWMDFPVGADGTLAANTSRNPNFAVSWPLDS